MSPCAIEILWTIVKNLNKIKNKKDSGRKREWKNEK